MGFFSNLFQKNKESAEMPADVSTSTPMDMNSSASEEVTNENDLSQPTDTSVESTPVESMPEESVEGDEGTNLEHTM